MTESLPEKAIQETINETTSSFDVSDSLARDASRILTHMTVRDNLSIFNNEDVPSTDKFPSRDHSKELSLEGGMSRGNR